MSKPGRPPKETPTADIVMKGSPKLRRYLSDLVLEEGYGNSVPAVGLTLIWRAIEDLIAKGVIDRIPGRYEDDESK